MVLLAVRIFRVAPTRVAAPIVGKAVDRDLDDLPVLRIAVQLEPRLEAATAVD